LAAEYLGQKHQITVSKETLRAWMGKPGLWKAVRRRVEEVHEWRARRHRCGELVLWYTSVHDWLEGRGETVFDFHDRRRYQPMVRPLRAPRQHLGMGLLWDYLQKFGRLLAFCTDKEGMFQAAVTANEESSGKDGIGLKCRRPRLHGPCGSWGSCGFRRTRRRPKDAWTGNF
jgi:hypothetical protein